MIPKSLASSSSDWDVLRIKNSDNNNNYIKDNGYSRKILPGAKRKQSNINDFLLAVGSKLSDSKGPYSELVFKPTSTSTPKNSPNDDTKGGECLRTRSRSIQQRQLEFPKRRSLSTGNLPSLSPRNCEVLNVLDQILQQETLTIKKYLLNSCWVKILVLEDTEF